MYQMYTKHPPVKEGPAVYLALKGHAKDVIAGILRADIAKKGGSDIIINKLDNVFRLNRVARAFLAFKDFVSFRHNNREKF